jgi:RHS repeat-associated protein
MLIRFWLYTLQFSIRVFPYFDHYTQLLWYNSRFYDPALGRWTQPDTIIPDQYNPADWDRFQYVRSNPLIYTDPSGNKPCFLNCEGEVINRREADLVGLGMVIGIRQNKLKMQQMQKLH